MVTFNLADIKPGATLSPINLLLTRELGRGIYGWVFLGKLNGNTVAAKIFVTPKNTVSDVELEQELNTLCSHTHITGYRNWYKFTNEYDDMYIVIMDYVKGRKMKKSDITKTVFHNIVSQIKRLHNIGIAHKNIIQSNLLIDESGNVHLVDVGIEAYSSDYTSKNSENLPPEVIACQCYSDGGESIDTWQLGRLVRGVEWIPLSVRTRLLSPDPNNRPNLTEI